jgi:hypothetical protein
MEFDANETNADQVSTAPAICPSCHQPVSPSYFFCPNCGFNLRPAPLPTGGAAQLMLYAHSIILPSLCFLSISKWKGYKYFKSTNAAERQIGTVAIVLLVLSTFITYWYVYTWTMNYVQQSISAVNTDLNGF